MRLTDQRDSFRCPVDETRQQCVLLVGDKRIPATLLDESTGGFSVMVKELSGVQAKDKIKIGTDVGWFSARVVHIGQIFPEDPETEISINELLQGLRGEKKEEDLSFRLGLYRLSDAPLPAEPKVIRPVRNLRFSMPSNRLNMWIAGLSLTFLMVALPWGILQFFQGNSITWLGSIAQGPSPAPFVVAGSSRQYVAPKEQPRSNDNEPESSASLSNSYSASHSTGPSSGPSTDMASLSMPFSMPFSMPTPRVISDSLGKLRNVVQGLSGVSPLLLPDVVNELKLSDEQQKNLRELAETTAQGMRMIEEKAAELGRQGTASLRAELLEKSREDAVKYLTDEQREQWRQLMGQNDEHPATTPADQKLPSQ